MTVKDEFKEERDPRPMGGLKGMKAEIIKILRDATLAIFICLFIVYFLFQPFKVEGNSMSPSLRHNERIIVNKFCYAFQEIERGDLIVFSLEGDRSRTFVKRVIGAPGDVVEIYAGSVYINGKILNEPYVKETVLEGETRPAVFIEPGKYYVLGDSRDNSNDSRNWGLIRREDIVGKVVLRYWPIKEFDLIN